MLRRAVFVVTALFVHGVSMADDKKLGLGELLNLAETSNLSIREGKLARERSEAAFVGARSLVLPRLLVESTGSYDSKDSLWASSAQLVLRQNLYDGGQSWSSFSRSRLGRERAIIGERRAREKMALAVLKAFALCSRLERNRAASRRKLVLLESQFDLVRRQFRQGRKTQRDYQLLEAELERGRLGVESVENEVFAAYRQLESTVGATDAPIDVSSLEVISVERILALKHWIDTDKSFNPESQSLELNSLKLEVEDRNLNLAQARREYWPVLSLNASAAYGSNSFVGPGASAWGDRDGTNFGVGLQLNWTLWDFGGVPSRVAQARVDKSLEELRFEQRKLELVGEHRTLTQNVERQSRVLEVQQRIRDLERRSFRDIEREYREGRSTYLDLITGLERDVQAELNFENEAYAYFVALAELLELKGTLYDHAKIL
jgi:outer membrane protein TolC